MQPTIHNAIFSINPLIVTIVGETAYDKDQKEVSYDMGQAQAKLTELQNSYTAEQTAQANAKASALAKLTALGLTQAEISAILGV